MSKLATYQAFAIYAKTDPTKTTDLRNAFAKDMARRFKWLENQIWKKVVTEDCFGLINQPQTNETGTISRATFAFPRSADKVAGFMNWLDEQVKKGILDVKEFQQIGAPIESAWTNLYVGDSYKRGVIRARYELDKAGFGVPTMAETGGISMSMSTPFHMDRVGLLYSRTYNELKGITSAMDSQISRVLSQGMIDGDNPRLLARKMIATITGANMGTLGITDTLGRFIPAARRAEMLARTEIIRAHHQATIQEYKNWAVEGIVIKGEWMNAQDTRVCPICEGLQGQIFTLEEINNMIPAHPGCRCIALPVKVKEDEKTAKSSSKVSGTPTSKSKGSVKPASKSAPSVKRTSWEDQKTKEAIDKEMQKSNMSFYNVYNKAALTKDELQRANAIGRTINDDIMMRLPKLEKMIVGKSSRKCSVAFERPQESISYSFRTKDVLAHYRHSSYRGSTPAIEVASDTLTRLNSTLHVGVRDHNIGIDLPSVIRHEYGHHVHLRVISPEDSLTWEKFYLSKGGDDSTFFSRTVSRYARTNEKEAFAESFAAWTSPQYSNRIAGKHLPSEIEDVLESMFGKILRKTYTP